MEKIKSPKEENNDAFEFFMDHRGNAYTSLRAMCKHWGTDEESVIHRLKLGWSLAKALTQKDNNK